MSFQRALGSVRSWCAEFFENTSMHGLKYVTERKSSTVERILWVLIFLVGLCTSLYFCWLMWQKWDQSPTLMSLDSTQYPVKDIAFPAVTICNVNKVSKKLLNQTLTSTPKLRNVSYEKMQQILRYLTKLDRAILQEKELNELHAFLKSNDIDMAELVGVLRSTAPTCRNMVMDCTFNGVPKPCTEYFSLRPTDDGYCCTFNGGNYTDPSLNISYRTVDNETLKVKGNGYRMGLALILDVDIDDYSVTNGKFDGFKVLLHAPDEFADVADRGFVIGPGFETFVGVQGVVVSSSEDVRSKVAVPKRRCLFNGEKSLKYYDAYSESACTVECATKLMLKQCGCRPYFFRVANESDAKLCDLKDFSCISDVYENIRQSRDELCDCLPTCNQVFYNPEISQAPFPGRGFNLTRTFRRLVAERNLSAESNGNDYFRSSVSALHVYYKEKTGHLYKIDIRFGLEDFISAMGGLLGLGLGFSIISGLELIYFLCLRCLCRKGADEGADLPMATSFKSADNLASGQTSVFSVSNDTLNSAATQSEPNNHTYARKS